MSDFERNIDGLLDEYERNIRAELGALAQEIMDISREFAMQMRTMRLDATDIGRAVGDVTEALATARSHINHFKSLRQPLRRGPRPEGWNLRPDTPEGDQRQPRSYRPPMGEYEPPRAKPPA